MKQKSLGKGFEFARAESQYINREAWNEHEFKEGYFTQKKGGFMSGIYLIIAVLLLYWWSAT